MGRHVADWQDLLNRDVALASGPVLDPEDPWGLGLLDLEDERLLMRLKGVEPPRPFGHMHLKHARLPVPPQPLGTGI